VTVHLVGAGPGDPGLLTVRGRQVLERAEVVVFDRLSVAALLDLAPVDAERISVGKRLGHQTMPQEEINALLVERGRAGQRVVRLKGGDPFVFARGGEEARALSDAGVPFEVVPGISSAVAVPAYAGIPVTLRHSSTSFTVVTGHTDPATETEIDWEAVASVGGTIVILMGVANIAAIADRLMAGGRSPDTPVAAVRWGTRPSQQTTRATLATIGAAALEAPSTIVVGDVAAQDLDWFEHRPLHGCRVVVTGAATSGGHLASLLAERGADPIVVPTIELADPIDGGASLGDALVRLHHYDWMVFTSATTVDRVRVMVRDARALAGPRIAVIGSGTAESLRRWGIDPDLVPDRFVAEGLLDVFPDPPSPSLSPSPSARPKVLLPRAEVARQVLPDGLRGRGWQVDIVPAYRTEPRRLASDELAAVAEADAVTFASASAVDSFVAAAGSGAVPPVVACIGPVVAGRCAELGIDVDTVADPHTLAGLVAALESHLA